MGLKAPRGKVIRWTSSELCFNFFISCLKHTKVVKLIVYHNCSSSSRDSREPLGGKSVRVAEYSRTPRPAEFSPRQFCRLMLVK